MWINLTIWMTSRMGTYTSTVALIGGPSSTYRYGLGYGIWQVAGSAWLFGLLPFLVMAVPMKRMASRLGSVTVPGWLSERFGSDKVRVISAILVAVMMIPYGTSVIQAAGVLLAKIANIPYILGIIIIVVTVTIYMCFSGFMGISVNALIQGWIMLIGAILIAPIALKQLGGFGVVLTKLNEIDPKLLEIPGTLSWGNFLSLSLVWGLICWGQPQLITRFYAVKDSKTLGITMVVVGIFTTLITGGYHLNGLIARAMYGNQFMDSLDMAIPTIAADMLPTVLSAIFVAAALTGSMFFALYWKRANWQGCLASMIAGTTVTLVWYILKIPGVHAYFPGMITSIIVFPIVSLLTPVPGQPIIEKAFGKQK